MNFGKSVQLLLLYFLLCSFTFAQSVYITNTGKKYHKESCRYLSQSKIEISLQDAVDKGYTACKVCKPSSTIEESNTKITPEKKTSVKQTPPKAYSSQCMATTKKGTRCKRKAAAGSNYCWQHK